MRLAAFGVNLVFVILAASASAQRTSIGIAPGFDAGGDDFGTAIVEHLTLYIYQDLLANKQFAPSLLNPGGVYTPLDTSWLTEYVQDRPDIDLLLVPTLKPTVTTDKGTTSTITIELSLLDVHTGDAKSTWTVSETIKAKNAWLQKGETAIVSAANERTGKFGLGIDASQDFAKQPLGKTTAHLAEMVRDTIPAHLSGLTKASTGKAADSPQAAASAPCLMHTRITYNYKHSVSHSYTLTANGLDQSTTILDGVSSFQAPEGPLLLQFTLNDAPYKLSRESIYQLSATHFCKNSTLVIDIGQGGDAHHHWE